MAFRSLSRPSSPPIAKASTSRPCFLLYFFLVTLVVIPLLSLWYLPLYLLIYSYALCQRSYLRFCGVSSTRSVSRDFVVYLEKTTNVYRGKPVVCLFCLFFSERMLLFVLSLRTLYKGGVPAAPSGTATLLRLSPSYRFYPRTLLLGGVLQVPPASMA